MRIFDADWVRTDMGPHDEREFVEIGSWPDRGTTETLLMHVESRQLYRKRSWTSRPAGQVWFRFIKGARA